MVAAYCAARYAIRLPGGRRVMLEVGCTVPAPLEALANAHPSADEGLANGFITAWNPHSQPARRDDNRLRQRDLLRRLRASARAVFVGAGYDAGWREPSLAALGIRIDTLDGLAREFRQNAILTFAPSGVVRLRMLRDDWRPALRNVDVDFAPDA